MEYKIFQMTNDPIEELKKSRRELAVLYEVSNAMHTTLELNHILYIILTSVTAHSGLGFNRAILFLVNHADRCLEPKVAIGPESGEHAQRVWGYISEANQHLDDLIQTEAVEQNIKESSLYKFIKELKIPVSTREENLLAQAYHRGTPMHISPDKIHQYDNDIFF